VSATAAVERPSARVESWAEANQRVLRAEFQRIKRALAGDATNADAAPASATRQATSAPAAIDVLTEVFALTRFERDLVLLCAGVEMDPEVATLCASAPDHGARGATLAIAVAALQESHWSALTPARPLRRWRLVEPADGSALATARLRIDERVLHYLAGVNYLDPRLQPFVRGIEHAELMAASHAATCRSAVAALTSPSGATAVIQLTGTDAEGQRDVAKSIAEELGLRLHAMSATEVPGNAHEIDALAVLWERESALLESALLIGCGDEVMGSPARRLVERIGGLVFVSASQATSTQRASLCFAVDKPERLQQKRLWVDALGPHAPQLERALDGVAAQFQLSARQIAHAARQVRGRFEASGAQESMLWQACRQREHVRLDELAQRIEPAAQWTDLVLPDAQINTLKQVAAHVRRRLTVYEEWGFATKGQRGLGVSALFAGESGTGKTMAAEVLAGELGLDLYRLDLASVVSKYIGETEKNLRRVFDAAEESGVILLFDEADALFGKRSEVNDSRDRYANIEVSYLLQRMEAYRGLAILTTNARSAIDTAFQRRLRFVVQFPFPDVRLREAIWRRVFPQATPLADVDYAKLGRLHVAGGSIRNIALNAAFLAAEGGTPVTMTHLANAAHAEAAKRERPLSDAETRGWM